MGDLVGTSVSGTLFYVPAAEFKRILSGSLEPVAKAGLFAGLCRINTLYMIARAGSGHIGSSFSSMDILSCLHLHEKGPDDLFFSSKGHDAPGYYATLIGLGLLDFDLIHQLRRLNGLPGHPDVGTPNIVTNTGSLGMGVSKGKGMIFANRLAGKTSKVFVLTGDGELQEGQFWESLISAANHKLHELTVIIDHNKLQSDTLVAKVSDLGDLVGKLKAFGWHVERCDGNDIPSISEALESGKKVTDRPKVIIADTIKGKGVSFMEHTSIDSDVEFYKFHSGAPSEEAYTRAASELIDKVNAQLSQCGLSRLDLAEVTRSPAVALNQPQRLVQAYSAALLDQARKNPKLVALDADLILDTGLIPFQKEFPERFLECGIAEQDMVSQAGGMALRGLLPVVHSFACFLSTRPNEQIYNNATEKTKIIYVGSLAGVIPGGPGHSHQGVRDISSLGGIPGLTMVEPCCEKEVGLLFDWCVNKNPLSSYLRLTSVPWEVPFELPAGYLPVPGQGCSWGESGGVALIGYGPIPLAIAHQAARELAEKHSIRAKVINLPWLNKVDGDWLGAELKDCMRIISLENHYRIGGQGDRIEEALAGKLGPGIRFNRVALDSIPPSGGPGEVLEAVGFCIGNLAQLVKG